MGSFTSKSLKSGANLSPTSKSHLSFAKKANIEIPTTNKVTAQKLLGESTGFNLLVDLGDAKPGKSSVQ